MDFQAEFYFELHQFRCNLCKKSFIGLTPEFRDAFLSELAHPAKKLLPFTYLFKEKIILQIQNVSTVF